MNAIKIIGIYSFIYPNFYLKVSENVNQSANIRELKNATLYRKVLKSQTIHLLLHFHIEMSLRWFPGI